MRLFQKNRKNSILPVFSNFSHFLWTKNHVLNKVGRGSSHNLFSIWYFRNLHALGYLKSVTVFWSTDFWVNKSLSMMCLGYLKSVTFFLYSNFWVNKSLSMMWDTCIVSGLYLYILYLITYFLALIWGQSDYSCHILYNKTHFFGIRHYNSLPCLQQFVFKKGKLQK
jgi:hypothetical protein